DAGQRESPSLDEHRQFRSIRRLCPAHSIETQRSKEESARDALFGGTQSSDPPGSGTGQVIARRTTHVLNDLKVGQFKPSRRAVSRSFDNYQQLMIELKVSHGLAGRTLSVAGWRLTEATYAPGQHVPRHEHALSSWTFVISGNIEETFTADSFVYGAGSVLTKPAVADHANRYGAEQARCLLIEFPADADCVVGVRDNLFARPRLFYGGLVPDLARRIYQASAGRDRATAFSLECLLLGVRLAGGRRAS